MKTILSFTTVFILLFLSFIYKDLENINGKLMAYTGEPKLYYRLARSEKYGIFSDAGLLGFCDEELGLRGRSREEYSVSTYWKGSCPDYSPYESQSGFQGLIYSLIDKFYKNPFIFKILCAAFISAVIASWFIWLIRYFGFIPSFLVMISILSFKALIFMGDNIAHVYGATYLIMVAMFWAYENKIKDLGTVAFIVVLFKFLLNGPEYIFCALLLPFVPSVFYAVLNKEPFQKMTQDIFLILKGVFFATFVSFLILMAQVFMVDSPANAMRYFINKVMARTFFPHLLKGRDYYMTINVTQLQVLYKYLSFPCVSIGFFEISFGLMILLFCIISIFAFYLYCRYRQRKLLAILITTWASVFCPLSWIFIAKGHSASHWSDAVVWYMPFIILGIVLTVETLQICISRVLKM